MTGIKIQSNDKYTESSDQDVCEFGDQALFLANF